MASLTLLGQQSPGHVIAMIFEYWFDPADDAAYQEYLEESSRLRDLLPGVEGFLGIIEGGGMFTADGRAIAHFLVGDGHLREARSPGRG